MTAATPDRNPPPKTSGPNRRWHRPRTDSWFGAILCAVIGGLIVYVLVDVLPFVHVSVSYHH